MRLLLLIFLIITIGCKHELAFIDELEPEDEIIPDTAVVNDTFEIISCINTNQINTSISCSGQSGGVCFEKISGTINLPDISKSFLPQYCLEANEEITYINQSGQSAIFRLIEKDLIIRAVANPAINVPCDADPNTHISVCADVEVAYIIIQSDAWNFKFQIRISGEMDRETTEAGLFGSELSILHYNFPFVSSGVVGSFKFQKIVDQGMLSYSEIEGEIYYANLNLNGQDFTDVFSYNSGSSIDDSFEFYYTLEQGLIGFKEMDGSIWTIE